MRKLIENPIYMNYNEIEERYSGRWVLIANCKYAPGRELLGGIVVAEADSVFKGQADGFYDEFHSPEYAPITDRDFDYDNVPGVQFFFNTLELEDEENVAGT